MTSRVGCSETATAHKRQHQVTHMIQHVIDKLNREQGHHHRQLSLHDHTFGTRGSARTRESFVLASTRTSGDTPELRLSSPGVGSSRTR
jgi:hypothetical protein